MRIIVVVFIGALGLAAGLDRASATPFAGSGTLVDPLSYNLPAASPSCGKGQRWVPAGYAKHGKYRAGHCAPK